MIELFSAFHYTTKEGKKLVKHSVNQTKNSFFYFHFKNPTILFISKKSLKKPKIVKKQNKITDPNSTAPEQTVENTKDLLPREPCLQALAQLRHAKWFQVCFCFFLYNPEKLFLKQFFSFISLREFFLHLNIKNALEFFLGVIN